MSKYKGLFTFDEDNHRYVPIAQADGIIDTMDYESDYEPNVNSLAELNEEWKDADDTNVTNIPLIKDEKIRKAVRAWANSFDDADEIKASDDYKEFWIDGYLIEFERPFNEVESEHTYRRTNIIELCGDEE